MDCFDSYEWNVANQTLQFNRNNLASERSAGLYQTLFNSTTWCDYLSSAVDDGAAEAHFRQVIGFWWLIRWQLIKSALVLLLSFSVGIMEKSGGEKQKLNGIRSVA